MNERDRERENSFLPADKLEQVFISCYPSLSFSPQREECCSVLESLFFPALLPSLLSAYRCRHFLKERSTAHNMFQHINATPKDLDVRRKFWLLDQVDIYMYMYIHVLSTLNFHLLVCSHFLLLYLQYTGSLRACMYIKKWAGR